MDIVHKIDRIAASESRSMILTGGLFLLFICTFVLVFWSGHSRMLPLVYPAGALLLGGWLYATQPHLYLGFVWWIWFLTPFVRRVIDYQLVQYSAFPLALMTPFIVTGFALFDVPRFGRKLLQRMYLPYMLILLALLYAYLISLAKVGMVSATQMLLEWLSPVLLGFHVLIHWEEYPALRRVAQSTFTWGVLVLGLYGIFQFFDPPPWDVFWLEGSGMTSIGRPEAFRIRVFGMLNAPGPYGMIMMTGLLLLFNSRGPVTLIASIPGYAALLLSMVRVAWGGWMLGLMLIIMRLRGKLRARLIVIACIAAVLSIPLLTVGPIAERVSARTETLTDVEGDGSFQARKNLYEGMMLKALTNPLGNGLTSTQWDSGIINVLHQFGWLGGALYFGGMFWMLRNAWRGRLEETDQFTVIITAIVTVYFVSLLAANQMLGVKGSAFWPFLSLAVASQFYHRKMRGE